MTKNPLGKWVKRSQGRLVRKWSLGGVVDRLIELRLPVTPYNGGEAAIEKERFHNARVEDYWTPAG
jgi:hypothetical protein